MTQLEDNGGRLLLSGVTPPDQVIAHAPMLLGMRERQPASRGDSIEQLAAFCASLGWPSQVTYH
ncbi:hypothetical protein [Bradyrhizobium brasilense]|uniref:hypothetical protein n=1 Tax=Bradyrhizobium brasilense TaxID=1419277 RepID=UPI001E65BA18|nr:hypothetical protein [Bradyrhizobium brasilense]MCC8972228.1 hypothetical protein [Bradyrhizobium brasilense]